MILECHDQVHTKTANTGRFIRQTIPIFLPKTLCWNLHSNFTSRNTTPKMDVKHCCILKQPFYETTQHVGQIQHLDNEWKMHFSLLCSDCSSFCRSCSRPLNCSGRHRSLSTASFHTLNSSTPKEAGKTRDSCPRWLYGMLCMLK